MKIVDKREQIKQSLNDKDYRHQFVDEEMNVGIAFQIRSLRNRQNMKQADLAKELGVKQPLISAWENPNYGKYTLGTLKDLAKAFDVGLIVRFIPFSSLVDWATNLSPNVIAPPNFNEERNQVLTLVSEATALVLNTKDKDAYEPKSVDMLISANTTPCPKYSLEIGKELVNARRTSAASF